MNATQPLEDWLPVVGYDGYRVSTLGRVYSLLTGKMLKPGTAKSGGYQVVNLSFTAEGPNGPRRRQIVRKVDHLVLEAFAGPRPDGDIHSRHLNDDPRDNRLANLQWGTRSENYLDAVRNGRHLNASKTRCRNGHEFTPENTKRSSRGRSCRECKNQRNREYGRRNYQPTSNSCCPNRRCRLCREEIRQSRKTAE